VARTQSLELAANNLANSSTTGYRAQQETFQQIYAGQTPVSAVNRAINGYGVLGDPQTDFAQGTLQKTGGLLDFAIEGRGFFVIQTPAGIRYSRDGSFHLAKDRTLLTTAGDPVLGEQGRIRVPEGPSRRETIRRSCRDGRRDSASSPRIADRRVSAIHQQPA
jgi:flagellar basal-body rod protein FlgF/flagellar basal-body rod protein FlgG